MKLLRYATRTAALSFCILLSACSSPKFLSQLSDFKIKKPKSNEILTPIPSLASNFTDELPSLTSFAQGLTYEPLPVLAKVESVNLKNPDLLLDPYENLRDELVVYAKQFLGVRYRPAGYSVQTGFDCSGFTSYVMANFGYDVPRASGSQAQVGVKIPLAEVRTGDLLFFGYKNRNGSYRVSHASLVISEEGEDMQMIHACRRGIVIDDMESGAWKNYYNKRFLFAKRIIGQPEFEASAN
ncbi:MAG: C40 family peptidase [Bernardetiaceae bacterium]|nr:C40 family peptidase [Bernardetiaceae bacterium]